MSGPFPAALLSIVLEPHTEVDAERLARALEQLRAEGPTLHVHADNPTGPVVIGGMSERHLEIVVDRLAREFHVTAGVRGPRVEYKETLTCPADGEMKYATQTGGRGQYGHAKIHVFPGERGTGCVFENAIVGGSIPAAFIAPIEEGIKEALSRGVLAGYQVDDVRVVLYDGSYHDVDSSETAFKIAGSMAFRDAATKAKPVLLEPVMRVEVTVPPEYVSEVMRGLSRRRGYVQSHEDRSGATRVRARVPLSKMFGYAHDLRSDTRGRGTYMMQLEQYEVREDDGSHGNHDSFVGAPRRPAPTRRESSASLPEPGDD